jgi:anti-sigma factor RsiW
MSCTKYDDFELGLVEAGEFERHLVTCPECRRQAALDERLSCETESLREPVDDAGLWARIESGLLEKGEVKREADDLAASEEPRWTPAARKKTSLFPLLSKLIPGPVNLTFVRTAGIAALALVAVGLAAWFLFIRPSPGAGTGLMADAALARVETEEREYAAAIEALEAKAGPKLAEMDFSLMALYRDRLETIDAQIERCREAIDRNPWNAHIRKYMLTALQDKRDTLGMILAQQ